MKLKVYIASPYTLGDVHSNVARHLLAADTLMSLGYEPFAPLWRHFQNQFHPRMYGQWLASDLEWVAVCQVVLRLVGPSAGADAEVAFAAERGIPVVANFDELRERFPPFVPDDRPQSRAVAIADRWSWSVLGTRYCATVHRPGVWLALDQQHPERNLQHQDREAIEWLAHRGLIEMASDFLSLRVVPQATPYEAAGAREDGNHGLPVVS